MKAVKKNQHLADHVLGDYDKGGLDADMTEMGKYIYIYIYIDLFYSILLDSITNC